MPSQTSLQSIAGFGKLRLELRHGCVTFRQGCVEAFDPHGAPAELLHALMFDRLSLFGFSLDPALQDSKFRPQVIFFGGEFGNRHGEQRFGPASGEAIGALVNGRDDQQRHKGRCEESQRENHNSFNHADTNSRLVLLD